MPSRSGVAPRTIALQLGQAPHQLLPRRMPPGRIAVRHGACDGPADAHRYR